MVEVSSSNRLFMSEFHMSPLFRSTLSQTLGSAVSRGVRRANSLAKLRMSLSGLTPQCHRFLCKGVYTDALMFDVALS